MSTLKKINKNAKSKIDIYYKNRTKYLDFIKQK